MTPTFPNGGVAGFWSFEGCLSSFRRVGHKLLLVMIMEQLNKGIKQRKLDSGIITRKGGYRNDSIKG